MGFQAGITAFQPEAFQLDAFQIVDGPNHDPKAGSWAPTKTHGKKKRSKKEEERILDLALAKAFEPKRSTLVDRTPWLIEPVPDAILIDRPEFNPRLAALHGEAQRIQAQLAQIQFNRAQEEADIELLLMAL